jgi:hypothetical protein
MLLTKGASSNEWITSQRIADNNRKVKTTYIVLNPHILHIVPYKSWQSSLKKKTECNKDWE